MSEYPWEFKKQNYPRRTPFTAMLQDIFELRGFDTGLKQLRFPANQNHTVRFARKIYSAFCWIICTQVKEGKKLRLH